jgi:hypothetical protein
VALNTKTKPAQPGARRATPTAARKTAAKDITIWEAARDTVTGTITWFRAKPHERVPLAGIVGVYGTGTALNAIHASPNGIGAAALVSVCGIVAASRKIKDGARAFKTCILAAGTGTWVTIAGMTGTVGMDSPHVAMNAGFGVLAGAAYFVYRRDDVIREKISERKRRETWPQFAHKVGIGGSFIESREDTRLGERLVVDTRGTGKRASSIASGSELEERIAEYYGLPVSRVKVTTGRRAGQIIISIRRRDPWANPIPHPLLGDNPEISLPVPNDITAGPLIIGQDPETGEPLSLSVWDEDGARRTMIVAALGGGKSVLLNNAIERITACRNAIVLGIDLTKAKDLREWRKGGAVPVAACGPEEKTKAALILKAMRAAIEYRAANNRQAVFLPGENRPAIVLVLDEIDGLVGGNSAMAIAAREDLTYIVSKGRSESVGVMLVGQRGTAKWLGGADLRALLEQVVLLKVNRPNEAALATGGMNLGLPDMTTYGEGKAGVTLICKLDGSNDSGRTFKFNDLDDVLAISSTRTPTSLEPGLIEHLGDIWTKLIGEQTPTASPQDAETIRRLDAEVEACMPEDLREQWAARQAKLDRVREYVENMPTVEHDPRVEGIIAERQRQFAEQAKAAGVPAAARKTILEMAGRPDGVKNREIVEALKCGNSTAHRYLVALAAEGAVEMRGRGRGARWHTTAEGVRDAG